jgi:hypothetical protein
MSDNRPESAVLDAIDALVDEQLQQESSGYDHNINQDRCAHCGEGWHGLAVKQRMRDIRYMSPGCGCDECRREQDQALAEYDYATDESPIICPGSAFIGPWISARQLQLYRSGAPIEDPVVFSFPGGYAISAMAGRGGAGGRSIRDGALWRMPDNPLLPGSWSISPGSWSISIGTRRPVIRGQIRLWDSDWQLLWDSERDTESLDAAVTAYGPANYTIDREGHRETGRVSISRSTAEAVFTEDPLIAISRYMREMQSALFDVGEQFEGAMRQALGSFREAIRAVEPEVEPEPQTPQQRALPRPSTTPPMWAVAPERSRRSRRNG